MPKIEHISDGVTLHLGDCRDVLPHLDPVAAVVTSPPYDDIRDYGVRGTRPEDCIEAIAAAVAPGGVAVWNVADQTIEGSETGTSFRQALRFMDAGLRLHDTMIYCKEGVTFPDSNRYLPAFEYMFVFSRGAPNHFHGIRDWRNKWAGSPMHGTDRLPDGSTRPIHGKGKIVPTLGLRRNWWILGNAYKGGNADHPAPMPYQMASDHIETWTVQGETVLDPFLGSGTAGLAAMKLGRPFVGIEIDPGYFDLACRRLAAAARQPDMFAQTPALSSA